jgi:putative flavoprotein involved in K+ transport
VDNSTLHYDTIIIGGGQAGLSTGYYLKQQGHDFIILDANERVGDSWRKRWDSLRLFTPACYNGLPGMPFPAPAHVFPAKDEMADYLQAYATRFALPIYPRIRVDRLWKQGDRFHIQAGDRQFEASNVVVAMANYQRPSIPDFAPELEPSILQMHSSEYRNPSQLKAGDVLVVGAGNSGAEIAMEVVRSHKTWLSGKYPGHIPFRIETNLAYRLFIPLVLRFLFHRILSVFTPIGRKVRPKALHRAGPLVRTKPDDITVAGVERLSRIVGVQGGRPLSEDGRILDVANVIWCTGFHPGFSWINLPVFDEKQQPNHQRGVVVDEPGLYFVGLHFLTAISSAQIHGVERDAAYIARQIMNRAINRNARQAQSLRIDESQAEMAIKG